jgi:hypothetical protein
MDKKKVFVIESELSFREKVKQIPDSGKMT